MLFLEMFIREEDLIFPLRTEKFLRAGWMVVTSLFRKEKASFCLSANTATFGCKAAVRRSERFSVSPPKMVLQRYQIFSRKTQLEGCISWHWLFNIKL